MTFWHEWRGSVDGRPSMLIRHIFSFRGFRLDLHKFIRRDDTMCFHTHPAIAIRIILWGGYVEERYELKEDDEIDFRRWTPGKIGIVRPELCHRIHRILNKRSSYSLWFRFPKSTKVEIKGEC